MPNEKVQFKRGIAADLPVSMTAGQILIETDTGNMYVDDSNNSRVQIKDNSKIQSIVGDGSSTTITYNKGDGSNGSFITKDTTYSNATTSTAGLMSAADKTKMDAIPYSRRTAEGVPDYNVIGPNSCTLGANNVASKSASMSLGAQIVNVDHSALVCGRINTTTTTPNESLSDGTSGNVFIVGNGTRTAVGDGSSYTFNRSNAFRVSYTGATYGNGAFNTSGADYAEFIKPWFDGNPDNEDRIGYMVTIKDGYLYKANEGDHIIGVTSGNPSIVGNADENYYWKYERDVFNRIIYEDVEEIKDQEIETTSYDENGNLIIIKDIVPVKTGKIIKNGKPKISSSYNEDLQSSYIERKDRPEWSYVGMRGIIPVRDDGTCIAGGFCKCGTEGVATYTSQQNFETYFVIERIADNVINIEVK